MKVILTSSWSNLIVSPCRKLSHFEHQKNDGVWEGFVTVKKLTVCKRTTGIIYLPLRYVKGSEYKKGYYYYTIHTVRNLTAAPNGFTHWQNFDDDHRHGEGITIGVKYGRRADENQRSIHFTTQGNVIKMYSYRFDCPRMTGVVIKEKVKCGKHGCRCMTGQLHKWYYYLYYREWDGNEWRSQREYVPKSKVKVLRRKISRWKQKDREDKEYEKTLELLLKLIIRGGFYGDHRGITFWGFDQECFEIMLSRDKRRRK